jgi:hypothetical protein
MRSRVTDSWVVMARNVCFFKSFIGYSCRVFGEAAMAFPEKFEHIAKLYVA